MAGGGTGVARGDPGGGAPGTVPGKGGDVAAGAGKGAGGTGTGSGEGKGRVMGTGRGAMAAVLAAAVLGGLAAAHPSADPDVWFHLALGRQMAEVGGIPDVESLCAVSEGRPFTNHEWLYDGVLWAAQETAGEAGWLALRIAGAAVLAGLSAALALRLGATPAAAVLAVLLAVPVVRPWLADRPHVAAYALALVLAHLLWARGRPGWGRVLALAAVAAAWANVHGSFPVAVVLAALRVVRPGTGESARDRAAWAGAALSTAAATLLNPWGVGLYATVAHHRGPVYRMLSEWAPWPWGADPVRDACFALLAAGAVAGFLLPGRRRAFDQMALLGAFLVPALVAEKFVPGLMVGAVPVLAAHAAAAGALRRPALAAAVGAALAAACLAVPPGATLRAGMDWTEQPREAMAFAREAGLAGRVFHPFNAGGLVEFAGAPALQAFIDGRLYIHDEAGVQAYLGAVGDPGAFRILHARYGFAAVLADRQDAMMAPLVAGLSDDPAWRLAWLDDRFALWIPAGTRPDLAGYRVLRPGTDPRYLFDAALAPDADVAAEAARVEATGRGLETARLARGLSALRRAGLGWAPADALRVPTDRAACDAAAADLDALAAARPDVAMFGYFRAVVLACTGRCDAAADAARAAAAFPDARDLARRLAAGGCTAR